LKVQRKSAQLRMLPTLRVGMCMAQHMSLMALSCRSCETRLTAALRPKLPDTAKLSIEAVLDAKTKLGD
jgi:hypothetical protein